ncbi:FMN-binding negative transcriptional regulator [Actinomadura barringtoniae]|uniref:FMN-binding negative transcriptional regulator n=1 Tax=Actinomadura barringtoniae TaxID=1427535 RepID=A0A939PJF7_9ACTN|nr:FMN-binding negative transcriptional regulator [Actinomadura barringtoniae]MBO2453765.1 FMN-binding negative transcriptional regulator [Actinomadura barringtoniae]
MLVHPWDAPLDDLEWKTWLADGRDFGQLIAPGVDRDLPIVVPTHFLYDGDRTIRLHLARPNPVWPFLEEKPRALLTVIDDYVYAPSEWVREEGEAAERSVPTSYYATAQLSCDVRIIDDPEEKAAILNDQLAHFEPQGTQRLPVDLEDPDRRLLPGIRGLELTVTAVRAKFKYAGNKKRPVQERISSRLKDRGSAADLRARDHLHRRSGL